MLDYQRHVNPFLKHLSAIAPGTAVKAPASLTHAFYKDDVTLAKSIATVFGTAFPDYLKIVRPKERKAHKEYREKVYENTMLSYIDRVEAGLGYIPAADDFDITWPSLDGEDTLASYTGEGYCDEGSFAKWFWDEYVPAYLRDPNMALLVLPEWAPADDQQRTRPRTWLIPSENLWQYRRGKFIVALCPETHDLDQADPTTGMPLDGYTLFIADHESYTICRQRTRDKNEKGEWSSYWDVLGLEQFEGDTPMVAFRAAKHYGGQLPARKIGKVRKAKNQRGEEHYASMLSTALPHVRLAQGHQSDIQVEFNFHVSSQEWRLTTTKCPNAKCKEGKIPVQDTTPGNEGKVLGYETCPTCKGDWGGTGSGLDYIKVPAGEANKGTNPSENVKVPNGAPGGFIPRSIEPVVKLVEEYKRQNEAAYACTNMQFMMLVPLAQSGRAKDKDREEMYRELNTQGVHIIDDMRFCYRHMGYQRYAIGGEEKAREQLPTVMEPVRFNLENSELVRAELMDALRNLADATVIEALTKKYLKYLSGETSDEYRRYVLRLERNPYKDKSDEMICYLIGLQLRNDESDEAKADIERLLLAVRFDGLVTDALADTPDFWELKTDEQYKKIVEANKKFTGPFRFGTDATGSIPTLQPLQQNPPVVQQHKPQLQTE